MRFWPRKGWLRRFWTTSLLDKAQTTTIHLRTVPERYENDADIDVLLGQAERALTQAKNLYYERYR